MQTGPENRRYLHARIEAGFLHDFQELIRTKTVPQQWKAMNDEIPDAPPSHSIQNLRIAAGLAEGRHEGMVFQDSDVAKWLEAAGYLLAEKRPDDAQLRAWVNESIDILERAQQPDGYLDSYFIVKDPPGKWKNLREAHELYCAGHLIEAAVALHRGTGDTRILKVATRLADHLDSKFGREKGKIRGYCGHEEVELALVKLARLTGEARYLDLALYFIEERGTDPKFFELEAKAPGFAPIWGAGQPLEYFQAHIPVRQQREAVGHAVRAMYLYIAMADIASEKGDEDLAKACDRLWESATARKMYVTGGIGASATLESFASDFDLPNDTAYAETCASIGLFLFSSRMTRLNESTKYVDVMERILYNGLLSGIGLDGESYFYVNPLEVEPRRCDGNPSLQHVKYRRQKWYGCACCPPNIARTVASLGEHLYHLSGDCLFVDLYHEGVLEFELGGHKICMRQVTRYPWDGRVTLAFPEQTEMQFTIALRVPKWCSAFTVKINGRTEGAAKGADGYCRVTRLWSGGDRLELEMEMRPQRIYADRRIEADREKVALRRGPIVYCLEEVDNGPDLSSMRLPIDAQLDWRWEEDLLGGIGTICTKGSLERADIGADRDVRNGDPYPERIPPTETIMNELKFIPYYAWANRGPGEMRVWVRE